MYCSQCGTQLNENNVCPNCNSNPNAVHDEKKPKNSVLANIISFFYPIAGLFFFLNWEDKEPEKAKNAGKSAIAGVIVSYALILLTPIISFFVISLIFKFII